MAIAAEAITACSPKNSINPTISPENPTFVATQIAPDFLSATPTQVNATNTPEILAWQRPNEEKFALGSFKIGENGFTIVVPTDLLQTMNFTDKENREYETKEPLEVITDYLPYPTDGGVGQEFEESAKKDGGRTPILFLTDRPNILVLDAHSESIYAPGEIARIIGSFWEKNQKKEDELVGKNTAVLGKNIIIKTENGNNIEAKIAFVKTVTKEEFTDDASENRFWGLRSTQDNIVFFMTDKAGIPDEIRNNQTPGIYYIIMIACMPQNGDPININPFDKNRYEFNTDERAIVVFEVNLNK